MPIDSHLPQADLFSLVPTFKPEIDQGDEVMIIFFKIFFIKASRRGGRPRAYKFSPACSPLSLLPTLATRPGLSLAEDTRVTAILPPPPQIGFDGVK
jgi:hypothetical protein